jgi:hypothetical protein
MSFCPKFKSKGVAMTIETELALLVKSYAKFDNEQKIYVAQLNKSALLKLDADFIKLINQQLLADGPEKIKIDRNYRNITRYFHPDRKPLFLPEVIWIEQNLAQNSSDAICFKTLQSCYEKLTTPQKYKEMNFIDIKNRADCRAWLEQLKSKAGTYTGRSFCDSLIGLLDESGDFFDEVGTLKPKGLRKLITFMPMIFASYGAIIFAEELFAVYALYFLMLKGGQYLGMSDDLEIKQIGKTLQEISIITAITTTTILVRLLEMTFWASHQCYVAALQIGSSLFTPLLIPSTKKGTSKDTTPESKFCKDLVLASQNLNGGIQFKTPELKVIAASLEDDLMRLSTQLFGDWRVGKVKRLAVDAFLFRMRVLDAGSDSTEKKLIEAKKELKKLKNNKEVYIIGGETAKAINMTEQVINLLVEEPSSILSDETVISFS